MTAKERGTGVKHEGETWTYRDYILFAIEGIQKYGFTESEARDIFVKAMGIVASDARNFDENGAFRPHPRECDRAIKQVLDDTLPEEALKNLRAEIEAVPLRGE